MRLETRPWFLYTGIIHEPDGRGGFARERQTISLVDITRIRNARGDVVEAYLDGGWIEIEEQPEEFRRKWEAAKIGLKLT